MEQVSKRCSFIDYLCKRISEFHDEILDHENSVPGCKICSEESSELAYIKKQLFVVVRINFHPKDEENPLSENTDWQTEAADNSFDETYEENTKNPQQDAPAFVAIKYEKSTNFPAQKDSFESCTEDLKKSTENINEDSAENEIISKRYECEYCGRTFIRKGNLSMHLKAHCKLQRENLRSTVRLKSNRRPIRKLPNYVENGKQQCTRCRKVYKNKHDCTKPKISKIISCAHCPEMFSTYKNIYLHHKMKHPDLERPLSPYQCDICGTFALHLHALKRHMTIHSGIIPFRCDLCEKGFRTRYQLTEHQRKHIPKAEKDDKYKCEVCQKKFKFRQSLKKHVEHQHTNNRKLYQCNFCGGKFISEATLLHHQATHDGEAPRSHKCDQCGRIFQKLKYFNHHRKVQHKIFTDLMLNPKNKKRIK